MLTSTTDWIAAISADAEDVFTKIVPAPYLAQNECRHEVVVGALSDAFVSIAADGRIVARGEQTEYWKKLQGMKAGLPQGRYWRSWPGRWRRT